MIRWRGRSVFPFVRPSTVQRRRDIHREALEVIRLRHADPDLSLGRVAHEIATSRRQLQRALAEVEGTTFSRELQRARMERAAQLLRSKSTRLNSSHQIISYAVFC